MALPTNQPIEFVYSLVSNSTGGGVVSPINQRLHVVRPNQTTSELVAFAEFVHLGTNVFKTVIPSDYVKSSGILLAFVTADNDVSSKDIGMFQIGSVGINTALRVPFVSRDTIGRSVPIVSNVTLASALESGSIFRSISPSELLQLSDSLSIPQPYYLVSLKSTETADSGIIEYSFSESAIESYVVAVEFSADNIKKFTIRLSPALQMVTLEFLLGGKVVQTLQTNMSGEAEVELLHGDYVIRMSKTGLVFTHNNVEISVNDELLPLVIFDASHTIPAPSTTGFCRINFRIVNPDGTPAVNTKVLFSPTVALTGTGSGVIKQTLVVNTNHNGEGSINLAVGITFQVNVENTRLLETFQVPNLASANLFDLISFEDRGFGYYVSEFPDSIRRTLQP